MHDQAFPSLFGSGYKSSDTGSNKSNFDKRGEKMAQEAEDIDGGKP